ncbi:NAD(P)-dependent oxidoreductase [Candidatus Kaiserbacteria bacterium]|nr:NAD(P)-dependent oxidoreductase [Candidatus Kaiserbacteria bacterium]
MDYKTYLVFGAAGTVGKAVVRALLGPGHRVFAIVHTDAQAHEWPEEDDLLASAILVKAGDTADLDWWDAHPSFFGPYCGKIDAVIYAVEHVLGDDGNESRRWEVPSTGMIVSSFGYNGARDKISKGMYNMSRSAGPLLKDGGSMVFISPAITGMAEQGSPCSQEQTHGYAHMITHQKYMVDSERKALIRGDPDTLAYIVPNAKMHSIVPAFRIKSHQRQEFELPKKIPTEAVAQATLEVLASNEHTDKVIEY